MLPTSVFAVIKLLVTGQTITAERNRILISVSKTRVTLYVGSDRLMLIIKLY